MRRRYRGLGAEEERDRFAYLEVDDDQPAPRREPPKRETRRVYELDCRRRAVHDIPESISSLHITDEATAAHVAKELLADRFQESFVVMHLNTGNQVIGYEEVAKGGVSSVNVEPVSIFRSAVCTPGVSGIILVHNHPSNDPRPSQADLDLTQKASELGRELHIPVLDHIIVGGQKHFAMRRELPASLSSALFGTMLSLAIIGLGALIAVNIARGGASRAA